MAFRLHGKCLFLTYPQCAMSKEEGLEKLMVICGGDEKVEGMVVAEEEHESGDKHLHAWVNLKNTVNWKDEHKLDLGNFHGNYQVAKHPIESLEYVKKHGNTISFGNIPDKKCPRGKSWIVANEIKTGVDWKTLMTEYSDYLLLHMKDVKNFIAEWNSISLVLTGFREVLFQVNMSSEEKAIGCWLNGNIGKERPLGKKQLWLYGKTGLGKSHLFHVELVKQIKIYFVTTMEKYFDGLDETYDLIVFDEYHAQQTVTFMNQILDGQQMMIPQKGHMYAKKKNTPVVIISNYPPWECYKKVYEEQREHYDAFERRIEIIECKSRINLY